MENTKEMQIDVTNSDAAIESIKAEIVPIMAAAEQVAVVKSAEDENNAVEFLSQIKRRFKIVDEARTFLVKPLNDHVKMINARFKETLEPLELAEMQVKEGMTAWRKSEEFKALEEKRLALEQEALHAVKKGDVAAIGEIAKEHKEASADAPRTVEAQSGKAHFREVTRFEIENVNALSRDFMMPDEKKIKAAVEAGAVIPGVKSWKEKVPVIR